MRRLTDAWQVARPSDRTIPVDQLGQLEHGSRGDVSLSSMCTVFAESEVVSLIAEGTEVCEIVRGFHRAIAVRTLLLVKRVARNPGVVRALS